MPIQIIQLEQENERLPLFGPGSGTNLLSEHPELRKNEKFTALNSKELYFAWLIGIKGSPVDANLPAEFRYKHAAAECFAPKTEKRKAFGEGDFPIPVKIAIEEFSRMSPRARHLALKATQDMYYNTIEAVKCNVSAMDVGEKKQYAELCAKTAETIPVLLKQLEEGYGFKEDIKKDEAEVQNVFDDLHLTEDND